EQTAASFDAIGAPRIAAKMRTVKNTSLGSTLMDSLAMAADQDPMSLMEKMKDVDPAKLMEEFRANVARAMPGIAGTTPAKPTADTDIESWEQLEHLLDRYVKNHESELRADMAKDGDPRAEPGFDPEKRMAELERLRHAEYDRESQREDVPKINRFMD